MSGLGGFRAFGGSESTLVFQILGLHDMRLEEFLRQGTAISPEMTLPKPGCIRNLPFPSAQRHHRLAALITSLAVRQLGVRLRKSHIIGMLSLHTTPTKAGGIGVVWLGLYGPYGTEGTMHLGKGASKLWICGRSKRNDRASLNFAASSLAKDSAVLRAACAEGHWARRLRRKYWSQEYSSVSSEPANACKHN